MPPLVLLLGPTADPAAAADPIVHNGKVWTGDPARPDAQAVAVWRGRVPTVGTDADVKALAGAGTTLIDLKGRRLVPGFYDSHLHFLSGGLSLSRVDLKDARDEAEFGRRLVAFDKATSRERWLVGGLWDHDRTFGGELPTAATIDRYVKDRPVFIRRYDGHMALANSAALKRAGIDADTKDPPGGVVYRLADGKTPSGILKDNAMALVDRLVPEPGDEEVPEAVLAALRAAAAVGVTSAQDLDGSPPETRRQLFRGYQRLAREGRLTCRLDLRWPPAFYKELANAGVTADFGSDFVRVGGAKGFMDGSLGSSTAKMFAPYDSDAKTTGVFVTPPGLMRSYIRAADAAGLNVCVHAIGDRANADLLDLFAEVAKQNGPRDRRFRIEHVQHLRPEDYKRFKVLGVVASMQPYHVIDDGRWAEGRIGAKRCASSYACTYAGDTRVHDVQPNEERLLSYAIDLGTEVDPRAGAGAQKITSLKAVKGIVTSVTKVTDEKTYKIVNRSQTDRTLLIEHPNRTSQEFKLVDTPSRWRTRRTCTGSRRL
jgi:predicted amidohydrolase YtcJ